MAEIDPAGNPSDRRWRAAEIDLSQFAGETVFLTFKTNSLKPDPEPGNLVGWKEPAFILPKSRRPAIMAPGKKPEVFVPEAEGTRAPDPQTEG